MSANLIPDEFEEIKGAKGFKDLSEIPATVQAEIVQELNKMMSAAVVKAKAKIKKRSGFLAKSITKKVKKYKDGGVWSAFGVNANTAGEYKGERVRPIKYAHLVELGFTHVGNKPVQAKPFLRPTAREVFGGDALGKVIRDKIDKALKQ